MKKLSIVARYIMITQVVCAHRSRNVSNRSWFNAPFLLFPFHYENTPIQIYRKLILQKLKVFR